tara:strand:+ start:2210 stop:3091 length:882 start_codon:yes stop_codon:yes gene_type:complete
MVNIPVFLASDDNYAPYVASTMASICDNTKSFIDFYILDGGITEENKEKIAKLKEKFDNFSLEFIYVDLEKEFKGFHTSGYITLSSYSRFLIPQLKTNLGKIIYSDVDVIAMGDIAEMYNEDMHGYAVAAVWEEKYENGYNLERKNRLELDDSHKYFCAGHLIMDCDKWRQDNTLDKLMKIATEKSDKLVGHDQDALNICFSDNYQPLPSKYSYFYGRETLDSLVIRHYTKIKPWEINPNVKNILGSDHDEFWRYAKMTEFYDDIVLKTKINDESSLKRRIQINNIMEKKWVG